MLHINSFNRNSWQRKSLKSMHIVRNFRCQNFIHANCVIKSSWNLISEPLSTTTHFDILDLNEIYIESLVCLYQLRIKVSLKKFLSKYIELLYWVLRIAKHSNPIIPCCWLYSKSLSYTKRSFGPVAIAFISNKVPLNNATLSFT